jgi:hypothetical protein
MPNTALGRSETAILTNKSGGAVAQGDVVIVDTANAAAFTTTTSSAFTSGRVGVVLEPNGIANNASGLIVFSGYVPVINLSGTGSVGDLVKTHSVAKQGVRHAAPQVAGDFAQALGTTATPVALLFGTVQLGAGSGINTGTSFPGSPATNDLYYRTDRGLLYFYDSTRWLTTNVYPLQFGQQFQSGAFTGAGQTRISMAAVWSNTYDMWLIDWRYSSYVATTNNGSNYWTVELRKTDGVSSASISAPTTASDAPDTYITHVATIGALLGTANDVLAMDLTKTSSPGGIYVVGLVSYRLVG